MLVYIDKQGVSHEIACLSETERQWLEEVLNRSESINQKVVKLASEVYTKSEVDAKIPNLDQFALKSEVCVRGTCASKAEFNALNNKVRVIEMNCCTLERIGELIPEPENLVRTGDLPDFDEMSSKSDVSALATKVAAVESAVINLGVKTYDDDLNSLKLTRRYLINDGALNAPATPCYLEVLGASSDFVLQRATLSDGTEKKRVYNGSVWSNWS